MKKKWETIDRGLMKGNMERLEVPGGWLVKYTFGYGAGLTFVPDKKHEWKL